MPQQIENNLCFETFTLDLTRGALRDGSGDIALRPKTFEVLRHLASNAGRLISKDELVAAAWGKATVSDESLARCICDIRAALGDQAGEIIKTVPRRGYRFSTHLREPARIEARSAGPNGAAPPGLSIVVLPFVNVGGGPEQEPLVDGITDCLTTDLSRILGAFVISRNTANAFKGRSVDVREIGRQLGVRYVLEGSVQRDQSRVRLNVQLLDAETGAHLWADRFENDLADLFELQDAVVARLANSLNHALVNAEAKTGARKINPGAFDLAMRGVSTLFLVRREYKKDNLLSARALFKQALAIDASEPDALAGNSLTYLIEYIQWRDAEADYSSKILDQADRAIAIDPRVWRAFEAKCLYLSLVKRADEALKIVDAGLAHNPNSAVLLGTARAMAHFVLGNYEQAIADCRQAIRLSPFDPSLGGWRHYIGAAEVELRRFDAAIEEFHKAMHSGYRNWNCHRVMAAAYAMAGRTEDASAALAEARRLNPALSLSLVREQWPHEVVTLEGLRKAGLPEK